MAKIFESEKLLSHDLDIEYLRSHLVDEDVV